MHAGWFRSTFLRTVKFLPLKEGEPVLQILWIISSPILYFNFKSCRQESSSSFFRFQWILFDWGVPFSDFWNFYKLRRGDLICWGVGGEGGGGESHFCRLFGAPVCNSIWEHSRTQILRPWLDFNAFYMFQKTFCHTSEVSTT